jgi:hypothetical protein
MGPPTEFGAGSAFDTFGKPLPGGAGGGDSGAGILGQLKDLGGKAVQGLQDPNNQRALMNIVQQINATKDDGGTVVMPSRGSAPVGQPPVDPNAGLLGVLGRSGGGGRGYDF